MQVPAGLGGLPIFHLLSLCPVQINPSLCGRSVICYYFQERKAKKNSLSLPLVAYCLMYKIQGR